MQQKNIINLKDIEGSECYYECACLNDSREFKEIENFKSIVYQGQIVMDRGYEELIIASSAFKQNAPSFIIRGFGPHEEVIKELISYNPENIRLDKLIEVKELVDKLAESDVGVV